MITGIKKWTLLVCLKRSSLSEKICLYFQVVFVQGETDKIIMCTAAVYSGYQDLKMRLKVFVVLLLEGLSHFP